MGKVLLTRRDKEKHRKELPSFGKIKHRNSGTILGKTISTFGNLKNAVTDRVKKAHQEWKQINYNLLRNKAVNKNKTDTMELTYKKHNDLWTTRNTNAREPNKKERNPSCTRTLEQWRTHNGKKKMVPSKKRII